MEQSITPCYQFIASLGGIFNSNLFIGLLGGITGVIIGGWVTYYFNKKHADELECKNRIAFAKALRVELSSLWKIHMNINGEIIEKNEIPYGILPVSNNFFQVFDNSANQLGLFEPEISRKIVETYINFKAFFEELIYLGRLNERYTDADNAVRRGTTAHSDENYNEISKVSPKILEHFEYLKEKHPEVKKLVEETTALLDKIK